MATQELRNNDDAPIGPSDRAEINPLYLFSLGREKEQSYLLLYPEGIIRLNDSAGNILRHCSGEKTCEKIIADLEEAFGMSNLRDDVYGFMEVALGKDWIRIKL